MNKADSINLLTLFSKYAYESIYTDNAILVRCDDIPLLYFYLKISFDDSTTEEIFLAEYDDLDQDNVLEELLKNISITKHLTISDIIVKAETHQKLFYAIDDFLTAYYIVYDEIQHTYISSDDIGMCPYYTLYYTIEVSPNKITKSFLETLISLREKKNNPSTFMHKYYDFIEWHGWQDFSKDLTIIYSNEIKTINLQTKVRRLAYLKMILNMFTKSAYYPANIFNRKIETEAEIYKNQLLNYSNSKGIIEQTKTGNSAKPYVESLLSLQLLYTQNNMYQVSKYGKLYNIIDSKLKHSKGNFFNLESYQKSFFLFFIFKNDELYFWILLNIIYIEQNNTTYKNIKDVFQDYLIKELQKIIESSTLPRKSVREITIKLNRIKKWKNPKKYLEHIIEPRINWLLDLDILDKDSYRDNIISLSDKGLIVYDILNSYYDIFLEKYLISGHLLCFDFFDMANELYEVNAKPLNDNYSLINQYINESFSLFKTLAPNRVTASQAILYTCYMVLFKEKKIVNFCTIKNYLSSKENTSFIFDWYKTENDGSIRRKNDL